MPEKELIKLGDWSDYAPRDARWHMATNFNMIAGHEVSVYTSFTASEVDSRWIEALQKVESKLWDAIDYEEKQ